jgi:hypothetical protein
MKTGVSYFSSRDIRHVNQDLREMADIGCSYVVHCYTETDLAHYQDTMKAIAEATREHGMETWFDSWGLAGIFSGETLSDFPSRHPETRQVLSDGRDVGFACPNHEETQRFLERWVEAAAAAGGDVLMWDEPHFYAGLFHRDLAAAWACYCDTCQHLFRSEYSRDIPREFTPELRQFREDSLIRLLERLTRRGHEVGLRNALCPVPSDLAAHGFGEVVERMRTAVRSSYPAASDSDVDGILHIGISDFGRCAAMPDLDIFGTDPYWYFFGVDAEAFMREYGSAAAEACRAHGRELQLWLQAFRIPAGREDELRTGVRVAEEVGADYLAAWSFRATESMSAIACKDPVSTWAVLSEEFRRVSG